MNMLIYIVLILKLSSHQPIQQSDFVPQIEFEPIPVEEVAPFSPFPGVPAILPAEQILDIGEVETFETTGTTEMPHYVTNPPMGGMDHLNLIDVERTYFALVDIMGHEPTMPEILYMVIFSEYWLVLTQHGQSLIGQEAVARSYYQFCDIDGCTHAELMKFLSGYQPFFDRPGKVDIDAEKWAEKLYGLLTNEYNYKYANGEKLYGQIYEILDVEFATEKGWINGKQWNRPSQWYGPAGKPPKGAKFGYGEGDMAILRIKYFGQEGMFFYFLTYEQEMRFAPPMIK